MNKTLIHNWNSRVKPNDTVFHLGDFCFRNSSGGKKGEGEVLTAQHYLNQLNGNVIIIKGNHDNNNSINTCLTSAIIKLGGYEIHLAHRPEDGNLKYKKNLCGHIHTAWKIKKEKGSMFINVGVDVWNFRPIQINEILAEISKFKK